MSSAREMIEQELGDGNLTTRGSFFPADTLLDAAERVIDRQGAENERLGLMLADANAENSVLRERMSGHTPPTGCRIDGKQLVCDFQQARAVAAEQEVERLKEQLDRRAELVQMVGLLLAGRIQEGWDEVHTIKVAAKYLAAIDAHLAQEDGK